MVAKKKTRRSRKKRSVAPKIIHRLFRAGFAVVILSALVLGVTLIVKEMSATDTGRMAKFAKGLLSKVNISVSEEELGKVAGEFASRISQTNLASGVASDREATEQNSTEKDAEKIFAENEDAPKKSTSEISQAIFSDNLLKIAVLSDIQDDLAGLENALHKAKLQNVDYLFLLGDLTGYGDIEALSAVKDMLDSSGMTYYAIPGDHDLAQSVGATSFNAVFEVNKHKLIAGDTTLLLLDNSANFTEINSTDLAWFKRSVEDADFVFLSQPLYSDELNTPFVNIFMGSTKDEVEDEDMKERQGRVLAQRNELLFAIRNSEVKAIFAGDHHKSSKQQDPEDAALFHYVVGAITGTVNELPQRLIQSPRFSVITILDDGNYEVEEFLLD